MPIYYCRKCNAGGINIPNLPADFVRRHHTCSSCGAQMLDVQTQPRT